MKTEAEFREYYEKNIAANPEMILSIGQYRDKIRKYRNAAYVGIAVIVLVLLFTSFIPIVEAILAGCLLFAIQAILWDAKIKEYKQKFYKGIYGKIVGFFDNLDYNPDIEINESTMEMSELVYCPEDSILHRTEGLIDGITVKICILSVPENKNNTIVLVNTLFIISGFNKDIQGKTIVNSDDITQKITRYLEIKNDPEYQEVKMEDEEFCDNFIVHCTSQAEARNILSTAMMERILQIQNEFNIRPEISFIRSHLFVLYKLNNPYLDALLNCEINYENMLSMFNAYNTGIEVVKLLHLEHVPRV